MCTILWYSDTRSCLCVFISLWGNTYPLSLLRLLFTHRRLRLHSQAHWGLTAGFAGGCVPLSKHLEVSEPWPQPVPKGIELLTLKDRQERRDVRIRKTLAQCGMLEAVYCIAFSEGPGHPDHPTSVETGHRGCRARFRGSLTVKPCVMGV